MSDVADECRPEDDIEVDGREFDLSWYSEAENDEEAMIVAAEFDEVSE